ncbi:TetR/AcrR family transcriptional regulator [Streptomyces sp. NBC_00249]|uniref:TetR/AcrR family transcriptional regulator n=1 Tax=Streptomyces sp. NBC_00249 TaxID=2975690 RepID=UPI00225085FC|nr:TetR/AcrR family transcriptional regulator [Streptomyces sp. NBC_00249]MCX5194499.1 TetR/AcrR family transcriptional regulator [Streptomyces sp. NBC_00249]
MPTARDSLLEAAEAALSARPWPAVKMTEVAGAAGVSRQTLYNEFGGKAGLGRALVRRAADRYLDGVDRALAQGIGPGPGEAAGRLAALAEWTVRAARARPLVRALLTGSWSPVLPAPPPPGSRQALTPGDLVRAVRDRAGAALGAEPAWRCELAVRLALSYAVAAGHEPGPEELLRLLEAALAVPAAAPVSGRSRRAGAR